MRVDADEQAEGADNGFDDQEQATIEDDIAWVEEEGAKLIKEVLNRLSEPTRL